MAPLLIALLLVTYPNAMAALSARRRWDQWHAFMIGNTVLGLGLLAYALGAGLLPAIWGHVTWNSLVLGAGAGLIPLSVILLLIFWPGPLGRDIVRSGIGDISTARFLYRLGAQVALATVVCEEFAFRGVLQVLLARDLAAPVAVAVDGALFGLWHVLLQYNGFASQRGLTRWGAALGGSMIYALLGLILAVVRQAAGTVLAAIVAHGVLDLLMFAGMFVRRRQRAAVLQTP